MPRLRVETAAERRQHIVLAAMRCFSRHGFHRTTMADLFRYAGISAGSFYSWFASKDDVVEAACRARGNEAPEVVRAALARPDVPAALGDLVRQLATWWDDEEWREESRVNVQVWGEALTNQRFLDAFLPDFHGMQRTIAAAIVKGQEIGTIDAAVDPEMTARVIWSILLGLEAQIAWEPELDARSYAEAAAALLTGAFDRRRRGSR